MSELVLAIESPAGPIGRQCLHGHPGGSMEEGMPRRVSLVAGYFAGPNRFRLNVSAFGVGALAGGARPLPPPRWSLLTAGGVAASAVAVLFLALLAGV